jgi:hypothetical protein
MSIIKCNEEECEHNKQELCTADIVSLHRFWLDEGFTCETCTVKEEDRE